MAFPSCRTIGKVFGLLAVVVALAGSGLPGVELREAAATTVFTNEIPFTDAAFDAAQKAGKPILIHFTADWCSVCRAQKPVLDSIRDEAKYKSLVVFNIDYDNQKDLVRRFNVRGQSTFIAFKGVTQETRSTGDTRPAAVRLLVDHAF